MNQILFQHKVSSSSFAMLLGSLLLVACTSMLPPHQASGTNDSKENTDTSLTLPKAELPLAIRVFPTCPQSNRGAIETPGVLVALGISALSSIAETVIPTTVSYLYDQAAASLNERQLRLSASSTAFSSRTFYSPDGLSKLNFGCIVLVRGIFSSERNPPFTVPPSMQGNNVWPKFWNQGIVEENRPSLKLAGPPELYIEFALEPMKSPIIKKDEKTGATSTSYLTTQLKVSPALVDYFASGAKDNPTNKKNLLVSLKVESVAKANSGVIFAREYDFGFLEIGQRHSTEYLDGEVIALPTRENTADGVIDLVPVKITAVVTETEPGRDFSRAIAKSLSDEATKKKITNDIAGQIVTKVKSALNTAAGTSGNSGDAPKASSTPE